MKTKEKIIKPVLQLPGSKFSVAHQISKYFPPDYNNYYEPMVGGLGVYLSISEMIPPDKKVYLADKNKWVIDTYQAIKKEHEKVCFLLESLKPTKEVYNRIKYIHPDNVILEYRAAHLIYLNQLCFGTSFRMNRGGYFNIPFKKTKAHLYSLDNVKYISKLLRRVNLQYGDFELTTTTIKENDFIYFDPPSPEKRVFGYCHREHDYLEFQDEDYIRLYHYCESLSQRSIKWAITDQNTIKLRLLFSKYPFISISVDKKTLEPDLILISNYLFNVK